MERTKFTGTEVCNKTLGIIASATSARSSPSVPGLRMRVIGYDPS